MSEQKPRRKPLSKRIRFEVFKRDHFTCAYCGAHPPTAILHVDHIDPVSNGGTNDLDNLVTSCSDCNIGKSSRSLKSIPESLSAKAKIIREREEQLAGYRAVIDSVRDREDRDVDAIEDVFRGSFGVRFTQSFRSSIRRKFMKHLDVYTLIHNAEIACDRIPEAEHAIKYFCGMNWRMIKGD